MPHVAFVPFTGLRICRPELRALGFSLPGLRRRGSALGELPALGLLTLAGMLPASWTCSYHPAADGENDELLEALVVERPTLVAISALTASIQTAYNLAAKVRNAGIPVVIGGLHVTACVDEAEQFCDAAVVGEGEPVWHDILVDAEAGSLRSRYQSAMTAHKIDWATPNYDLIGNKVPRFTLQTQRGCPLSCDFCAASRLLGPFREKPVSIIMQEIATISRLSPRPMIELADDNTFAGKRDAESLCNVLAANGARWFTECDWRIGERPELLSLMAASGCVQVLVGLESMVFRYPGMGAKQAELERMMAAVEAIQEAGIAVNGCFIMGADGETRASIDRMVRFVLDSCLADVQLTLQTPFPGTKLRRRLEAEGRLLPSRGWSHYTLLDVTFQPDCLTVAELELAFLDSVRAVYSVNASSGRNMIRRQIWQRNKSFHTQE